MIVIDQVYANNKIKNRDENPTEFEVQSFLYGELKAKGKNVRGELVHIEKKTKLKSRFDLVLFDENDEAEVIIEVKSAPVKHKTCLEDTRQYKKYTQFGCRVVFIYGINDAKSFLEMV